VQNDIITAYVEVAASYPEYLTKTIDDSNSLNRGFSMLMESPILNKNSFWYFCGHKGESMHGSKASKDSLITLLGINEDGDFKLKPIFI
jgi:hypothetical protein